MDRKENIDIIKNIELFRKLLNPCSYVNDKIFLEEYEKIEQLFYQKNPEFDNRPLFISWAFDFLIEIPFTNKLSLEK